VATTISALFTDVGGVLLTNGWDRQMREQAAARFNLDAAEFDERHHQAFDTYEEGKLSLAEYLNRVVFYRERPFSIDEFTSFMFAQSQPYPDMLSLVLRLKQRYDLKVVVVSNEGRELTRHRIETFHLSEFVDIFVASCYVHCRKPDADIFRLALDVAQVAAEQVVYLEDRPLFVEVAQSLGIRSIRHVSYESTRAELGGLGLVDDDRL